MGLNAQLMKAKSRAGYHTNLDDKMEKKYVKNMNIGL